MDKPIADISMDMRLHGKANLDPEDQILQIIETECSGNVVE